MEKRILTAREQFENALKEAGCEFTEWDGCKGHVHIHKDTKKVIRFFAGNNSYHMLTMPTLEEMRHNKRFRMDCFDPDGYEGAWEVINSMENSEELFKNLSKWFKGYIEEFPLDLEFFDLTQFTNNFDDVYGDIVFVDIPEEETSNKTDSYGRRDFIAHATDIFIYGERIFHTVVAGEKYIVHGLHDNDDLIVLTYKESTMELVDRLFIVGAQDGEEAESESLADYFYTKFVGEKNWGDSWFMTQKQLDFLKNA